MERREVRCDECGEQIGAHEAMVASYRVVEATGPEDPGMDACSVVVGPHETPREPGRVVGVIHKACESDAARWERET